MDATQLFPSKYIKGTDIPIGQEFALNIIRVAIEDVGSDQSPEQKPVLYFERSKKGLILNATNNATLIAMYGKETDAWLGKPITLFSMMVQGPNGIVPGVRLKGSGAVQTVEAPAAAPAAVPFDDPIPLHYDGDIPFMFAPVAIGVIGAMAYVAQDMLQVLA